MSEANIVKTECTSNFPDMKATFQADISIASPEQQIVYVDLLMTLQAAALAKLGSEFLKWISGDISREEFDEKICAARQALI